MWWRPRNVSDYERLIFKVWKYTGLPVFEIKRLGNSQTVIVHLYFYILLVLVCLGVINVSVFLIFCETKVDSYRIQMQIFLFAVVTCQNIFFTLFFYIRRNNVATLLTKFLTTEKIFLACFPKFGCLEVGAKLAKYLLIKVLYTLTMIIGDCLYLVKDRQDYLFRFCFFPQLVFFYVAEATLIFFVFLISKFYTEFGSSLKRNKQSLTKICSLYWAIRDLSRETNQTLQFVILLKFATDLFLMGNDLFFGTHYIMGMGLDNKFSFVYVFVIIVVWCVFILYVDITVTYVFDKNAEEVSWLLLGVFFWNGIIYCFRKFI
uniref:Gustatory receptor n=1 Tax=Tribolium castaneum TaxID=7070 RepID=B8PUP2_TRICA|nr:gustatory receptor [Tribolium castaneum]